MTEPSPKRVCRAQRQGACSDEEDDYDNADGTRATVQLANSAVLIAALEEIISGQDKNSTVPITIAVVRERPSATECSIQRFTIPSDSSQEAAIMSNLPEELSKPLSSLIISAMDATKTGVVTTIIDVLSVEGLKVGGRFDITIPARDLLSELTQQKNKAVTLYFLDTGLRAVIYDFKDPSVAQTITLTSHHAEEDETDPLHGYHQSLKIYFSQCVFIHVKSLYDAVSQSMSNTTIKVHQLSTNNGEQVTRIVQICTGDTSSGVHKSCEFWVNSESTADTASNCQARPETDEDTSATQDTVHRHTKMMEAVEELEAQLRLVTRNTNANPLHHELKFKLNDKYKVLVCSEGNWSYRKLVEAKVQQRSLARVLKPVVDTKRIVSLLFPDKVNEYMMIFVPLGGDSKLLKLISCMDDEDDED